MDAALIQALTAKVNAIPDCGGLQDVTNQIMGDIQQQVDQLRPLIDHYNALIDLKNLPTNPEEVITYLGKLKDTLILPQLQPLITIAQQAISFIQAVEQLTAAIEAKAATITNCSVTVSFTPPVLPPPP